LTAPASDCWRFFVCGVFLPSSFTAVAFEKQSACKINLLLNILGRRTDGFHELETLIYPIHLFDHLTFSRSSTQGIHLACSDPRLATDSKNLVYRAASLFLNAAGIKDGVSLYLQKNIPLAAGLGGGSANAATTLLGLNDLFGGPLAPGQLLTLAACLGSDVPFFLQDKPALATSRGEKIQPLDFFPAFQDAYFVLIYPGFGISTAWAYQQLARFPAALNGQPGRAERLISLLHGADPRSAGAAFYNSLEAPAVEKYPLLALLQEFMRSHGAIGTLLSGSGSSTFALAQSQAAAHHLLENFKQKFGDTYWTAIVPGLQKP